MGYSFVSLFLSFLVLSLSGCSSTIGNIKTWFNKNDTHVIPSIESYQMKDLVPGNGNEGEILVGFAKGNITPHTKQYLAGFYPTRTSDGIHDELWVKSLTISDYKGNEITIVTTDLIGLLSSDIKDIKSRIKKEGCLKEESIIIASSHTHSAPDTVGLWGEGILLLSLTSGRDENYLEMIKNVIVDCVLASHYKMHPVTTVFSEVEIDELMIGRINNIPHNKLSSFQFILPEGRITLVNFGLHPTALYNRKISADFVYYFNNFLETLTGGEVIFVNGALGGVNPLSDGFEGAKNTGEQLALYVYLSLRMGSKHIIEKEFIPYSKRIIHKQKIIEIPLENNNFIFAAKLGMIPDLRNKNGNVEIELNYINICGAEILTVPGEMFPSLWERIKIRFEGRPVMLFGLANGMYGYILSEKDFLSGDHPYHTSVSVGPKIGEMIERAFEEMIK